jgi:hypothetical protein
VDITQVLAEHGYGTSKRIPMTLKKIAQYNQSTPLFNNRIWYKNGYLYGKQNPSNLLVKYNIEIDQVVATFNTTLDDYWLEGNYIYAVDLGALKFFVLDLNLNIVQQVQLQTTSYTGKILVTDSFIYVLTVEPKLFKISKLNNSILSTITLSAGVMLPANAITFAVDEVNGKIFAERSTTQVGVYSLANGALQANLTIAYGLVAMYLEIVNGEIIVNAIEQNSNYDCYLRRWKGSDNSQIIYQYLHGSNRGWAYNHFKFPSGDYALCDNGQLLIVPKSFDELTIILLQGGVSGDQAATDGTYVIFHDWYTTRLKYQIKWR